jgi:hypothetical protein
VLIAGAGRSAGSAYGRKAPSLRLPNPPPVVPNQSVPSAVVVTAWISRLPRADVLSGPNAAKPSPPSKRTSPSFVASQR